MNLATQKTDVTALIFGGGINGLGVFWDLALQGVDCLIVDKGDFCSAASGASSRVIHGGIKYLETGEFNLVSEATIERNRLLKNAPHVVRPLEIVLTFPSWIGGTIQATKRFFGLPSSLGGRGAIVAELGLHIFDFLGRRERATSKHRYLSRDDLQELIPMVAKNAVAGALYHDATINQPERLGIELALDAMAANEGCIALNYVSVVSAQGEKLTLRDQRSKVEFSVIPKFVINATGAWIDDTNQQLNIASSYIRGTKGSHIVLHSPPLIGALAGRMVCFDAPDGRECFVYPVLDRVLLGSTDLDITNPDEAHCENEEIEYLLAALHAAFPLITLSRGDIVHTYSGVRPLQNTSTDDPSQISRATSIRIDEPDGTRPYPVLSVIGGKWTTFRATAEKVTEEVLKRAKRKRKVDTRSVYIGGGQNFPATSLLLDDFLTDISSRYSISRERAEDLVRRYGSNATLVAAYCNTHPDDFITIGYTRQEIAYIAAKELVTRLADIIIRRTSLGTHGRLTAALLGEVAGIASDVLGWNGALLREEIDHTTSVLRNRNTVL